MKGTLRAILTLSTGCLLVALGGAVEASELGGGPRIQQDPRANVTGVFAFVGTRFDDPSERVLNVLVQVGSHIDPASDARFADDALYSVHITNPTTGRTTLRYDFRFSDVSPSEPPGLKNPDTILSYGNGTSLGPIQTVGDASQNYTQTYGVDRDGTSIGEALAVPPPNVGRRVTPFYNDPVSGRAVSGAVQLQELDLYTREGIHALPTGEVVFAGPREDAFYGDLAGVFDLLDPRLLGVSGGGVDGQKGFNVLSYGIQIPIAALTPVELDVPLAGSGVGVGVYATVNRRPLTFRGRDGSVLTFGRFRQVRRVGNPLFSELFLPVPEQDAYDGSPPTRDASSFAGYAQEPELAELFNVVFGTSYQTSGRSDVVALYVPDVLRVVTTTGPVPLPGQIGFSRLSGFGGDTTDGFPSGWPNGRRIGDDVVDILFTAIASGPTYSPVTVRGDNVNANDQLYHRVFPYLGTPHAGTAVDQGPAP